jgi:hypothetical protein
MKMPKYMCMHKVDAKMEAGERPPQELIQKMGQFVGGLLKNGVMKDGGGLHRSAMRARITFPGGTPSVERGPFAGRNELVASFALISTTGIEKAIELGIELAKAAGNADVEVGPLVEGWDLNGSPRPADAPFRFLLLVKASPAFESGTPLPAEVKALLDRWTREGIVQSQTALEPTKAPGAAARYKLTGGKRQWIDGPFAESKELIAGFAILELPSLDAVKAMTEEYASILGDNECDVRALAE